MFYHQLLNIMGNACLLFNSWSSLLRKKGFISVFSFCNNVYLVSRCINCSSGLLCVWKLQNDHRFPYCVVFRQMRRLDAYHWQTDGKKNIYCL